jgi:hypothetical protein
MEEYSAAICDLIIGIPCDSFEVTFCQYGPLKNKHHEYFIYQVEILKKEAFVFLTEEKQKIEELLSLIIDIGGLTYSLKIELEDTWKEPTDRAHMRPNKMRLVVSLKEGEEQPQRGYMYDYSIKYGHEGAWLQNIYIPYLDQTIQGGERVDSVLPGDVFGIGKTIDLLYRKKSLHDKLTHAYPPDDCVIHVLNITVVKIDISQFMKLLRDRSELKQLQNRIKNYSVLI